MTLSTLDQAETLASLVFRKMRKSAPAPLFVTKGITSVIHCALFYTNASDEEFLLVGTEDGTVQTWDLKTCKRIKTVQVSVNACLSLHVTKHYLITQDKTCKLDVWNLVDSLDRVFSQEYNNISFCKISVLDDDDIVAYVGIPQTESRVEIHTFSSEKITLLSCCQYYAGSVKLGEVLHVKMFRIDDKPYLAVIYENGMLIVWDLQATVMLCDEITCETPMSFDFDADRLQGICGTAGKTLIAFKLDETWRISKRKTIEITNPGVGCVRIRSDRKIVAVGCWDGKIRIFSWKTCKLLAVLECHTESVLDACFASSTTNTWGCKHLLAAVASDKRISLWNIFD